MEKVEAIGEVYRQGRKAWRGELWVATGEHNGKLAIVADRMPRMKDAIALCNEVAAELGWIVLKWVKE